MKSSATLVRSRLRPIVDRDHSDVERQLQPWLQILHLPLERLNLFRLSFLPFCFIGLILVNNLNCRCDRSRRWTNTGDRSWMGFHNRFSDLWSTCSCPSNSMTSKLWGLPVGVNNYILRRTKISLDTRINWIKITSWWRMVYSMKGLLT